MAATPPFFAPLVEPEDQTDPRGKALPRLKVGDSWMKYFGDQQDEVDEKPARKAAVILSVQNASISTTPFPLGTIPAGVWRLSYIAQITTAAATSSSLTVTFSWTANALAKSSSAAAITGNTTTTLQFGTLIIRVDTSTPISYSTTYASNGAGEMQYSLDLVCEALALD